MTKKKLIYNKDMKFFTINTLLQSSAIPKPNCTLSSLRNCLPFWKKDAKFLIYPLTQWWEMFFVPVGSKIEPVQLFSLFNLSIISTNQFKAYLVDDLLFWPAIETPWLSKSLDFQMERKCGRVNHFPLTSILKATILHMVTRSRDKASNTLLWGRIEFNRS